MRAGHQRLNAKYGWVKRLGDVVSRLRTRARVVIAIEVGPENRSDDGEAAWPS